LRLERLIFVFQTGINYFDAVFQVGAVIERAKHFLNFNTKMGYFFDSLCHYKIKKLGYENYSILLSVIRHSRVFFYIYIYIYYILHIYVCSFKSSGDAFRLPHSIVFGCSIRPFLDLYHS
jgi:hypothetical protein